MSQRRKRSAIENGRRPLKAHIPYRADDLTHGKKTGVNVREVDRKSDGFESFGEVLIQADGLTPPHMRNRRRRRSPSLGPEPDENGEMSMELDDDSRMHSLNVYFSQAPRPSISSSVKSPRQTSHLSNRLSRVDYDRLPTPRASSFQTRMQQNRSNDQIISVSRTKSSLSRAIVPASPEIDDDDDNDDFGAPPRDDFDNDPIADYPSSPAGVTSFTEMDRDDDGLYPVDDVRISSPTRPIKVSRVNGSRYNVEDDNELLDMGADGQAGMREESAGSDASEIPRIKTLKKKRSREDNPPREKRTPVKRKRVQVQLPTPDSNSPSTKVIGGVRRGTRTRYKPLEWWRNEKVVYGRREHGLSMVPVIKDIVRLPKEPPVPLGIAGKRYHKPRSRSRTAVDLSSNEVIVYNPEEGWDDETEPFGVVYDFKTGKEVERRVAYTASMVKLEPAANNEFEFQKVFGDGEFIAAGQLVIPVGSRKPSKGSKDNTYVFYIMEGAINLKVHRTSFVLATGGMFLVPRGNTYYIENISQRPARLFFAQGRRVKQDELTTEIVRAPSRVRSVEVARSSSHPTPSSPKQKRATSAR